PGPHIVEGGGELAQLGLPANEEIPIDRLHHPPRSAPLYTASGPGHQCVRGHPSHRPAQASCRRLRTYRVLTSASEIASRTATTPSPMVRQSSDQVDDELVVATSSTGAAFRIGPNALG